EPVEDPDGAEADDHEPVPSRPRQPVHAGRDVGLDRAGLHTAHVCGLPFRAATTERAQGTFAVVPGESGPKHGRNGANRPRREDAGPGVSLTRRTTTRSCRPEEVSPVAAACAAVDVP